MYWAFHQFVKRFPIDQGVNPIKDWIDESLFDESLGKADLMILLMYHSKLLLLVSLTIL